MKDKKGFSEVISTLIIILLVLVAVGLVWAILKNMLDERCIDKEIPIRLINVTTGKDFIVFKYIWTGDNNNLSLIASKYAPFKFIVDGITYTPKTEYKDIIPILFEENDTIEINHTITSFVEFNYWSGENILIFRHTDNEKCVQEIVAGNFIE